MPFSIPMMLVRGSGRVPQGFAKGIQMRRPWIPNEDSQLSPFGINFATLVNTDPARYGVTPADAAEVLEAASAFTAAYQVWNSPATATSSNLCLKDEARAKLVAALRRVGALVRVSESVTAADKIAMGVKPTPRSYPRTPAPQECPALSLTFNNHTGHTLRVYSPHSTSAARPRGTVGVLLFRTIAETAVNHPDEARFVAFVTRDRIHLEPARGHNGKRATYFARWAGTKGELGPWSTPISASIAA
jgi:hypothetical protein